MASPPDKDTPMRPVPNLALLHYMHQGTHVTHRRFQASSQRRSLPQSRLETLPIEIVNEILSYLTHPRARLPGLTEAQSAHDFPRQAKFDVKSKEDLTQPLDANGWAADLFSLHLLSHPFNALSLTSRRCNKWVESYCAHLVRCCNDTMFNLPFAQFEKYGPQCVHPDLSGIVYRRLWLQHAPRRCVYCYAVLDCYPFPLVKRVLTTCGDCFYRQTLHVDEVQSQYHLSRATIVASPQVRGNSGSDWVLRVDVEALAWQLYRTRAFHSAHVEQLGKPCSLCAITRFTPKHPVTKIKSNQKATVRQLASMRKRSTKRSPRY